MSEGTNYRTTAEQAQARAEFLEARQEAAWQVLWFNGDQRGREPGSFISKLLEAWSRADLENDVRLSMAFPVLGQAVRISRTEGSDAVAKWAGLS